ncbi:hypothetical protein SUGI_0879930 [Cryptomeria japonica]|nr:hypothetical protein SUGI_0879930 [Cryptomeria japonica]
MIRIKHLKSSLRRLHTTNGPVSSSDYARMLKDCAKNRSLLNGKLLHAQIIISSGFESINTYVQNNLLSMYAKCQCPVEARRVFEEMPCRDVVTWTAMIGAYARAGNGVEALNLFTRMREKSSIKPNEFTCASVLPAVTSLGAIEEGKRIHEEKNEVVAEIIGGNGEKVVSFRCCRLKLNVYIS